MNFVISEGQGFFYERLLNQLDSDENRIYVISTPDDTNAYLAELIAVSKECKLDTLMSLGFFKEFSLAAGALGIKYKVYLTEGYDSNAFDKTILNPWNEIVTTDALMVEELKKVGANVCRLTELEHNGASSTKRNSKKIYVTEDENDFSDFYNALSVNAKGYLDGLMAVMRQKTEIFPVFANLPIGIRNEIEMLLKIDFSDNLEKPEMFYDRNLIWRILTSREVALYKEVIKDAGYELTEFDEADTVISIPDRMMGTSPDWKDYLAIEEGKKLIASARTDFGNFLSYEIEKYNDRYELLSLLKG